ncbi:MAG: class I SAM-dependent methyltransferase [Gammaproteobacteria bacterium]|nr:class I SAM-dependent methyltransferase [Gammaproteobacteria bacterium]
MTEQRNYQPGFSQINSAMHDSHGRRKKAVTMVAVCKDVFNTELSELGVLDVGGSTGHIDDYLANFFKSVRGIDIDQEAVENASQSFQKDNLEFNVGDAMEIDASPSSFDLVICSQVYEHVPDARKMMSEIYRVLKPGGYCYFAASNRLMWNEPHYNLPLLSVIPRPLAHYYVRKMGKADFYHELHFSYWGLKKLVNQFELTDYTKKIINDPECYHADYMLKPGTLKHRVAKVISKFCFWLTPGYIWMLRKPVNDK